MWMPGLQRAQVFQARGVLFTSIGHSVRRSVPSAPGEKPRTVATLELLPEEALYLVERGSMLCFRASSPEKESRLNADVVQNLDVDGSEFAQEPMTVQQAFAEMIGKEDLTLPRYQVRFVSSGEAANGHEASNFSCNSVIPTSNALALSSGAPMPPFQRHRILSLRPSTSPLLVHHKVCSPVLALGSRHCCLVGCYGSGAQSKPTTLSSVKHGAG